MGAVSTLKVLQKEVEFYQSNQTGKWKVGLFESYKPSLGCLLGCYCPPIGNFMVAEKIPGMRMWKWLGFVDCCCPTFGIATCVLNMMLRDKIREKDGIEGSFCDDCLSASLCCLCSVCQTYNQVKMDGTEGISFDDRFKASCCLPCLPCYACLTYNM